MVLYIPNKTDRDGIATEYDNMVTVDMSNAVLDAWDSLKNESLEHARILKQSFKIELEFAEPYSKASDMFADLENHTMRLSILENIHPLWSEDDNLDFRIAHDILGHWKMGTCHNVFSFAGEINAFKSQARYLRNMESKQALYTEVIGQAAYRGTMGKFGEQKIGFIHRGMLGIKAREAC